MTRPDGEIWAGRFDRRRGVGIASPFSREENPEQVHAKRARASSASKAQNEHFKKPDRNHKHCERYRIVLKPIPI
jgi:hypothetical protein